MYLKLVPDAAQAMALALIAFLDAETGPCTIDFYAAPLPALPTTGITTQTLLGTVTCSDPVASSADGTITFGVITSDAAADATGTAAWARLRRGAGGGGFDADVSSVAAGTGLLQVNTTAFVAGGPINVTSLVIVVGG